MTNIKYETEIIRVLHAAGQEGLSVQKISLHVRNACSSLFEPLDMEEVHRYVQAWLVRNVKGGVPYGSAYGKEGRICYKFGVA